MVSRTLTPVSPEPSDRAVASMSRRWPGSSVSGEIASTVTAGFSARTTTSTVTGTDNPLVTVSGKRPEALDRATNVGPVTVTLSALLTDS